MSRYLSAYLFLQLVYSLTSASSVFNGTRIAFSIDQSENAIADFGNGQGKINLEIFGESLCPDTSRFLYYQLLPVWREFKASGLLNIIYHPYGIPGKTSCTRMGDDYSCRCQHGPLECQMNQLQLCVIQALPDFRDYLEPVICIQGKRDMNLAIQQCFTDAAKQLPINTQRLAACANGVEGRRLLAQQGVIQSSVAPTTTWVPWIMVNGRRERVAEYHLRYLLCSKFY